MGRGITPRQVFLAEIELWQYRAKTMQKYEKNLVLSVFAWFLYCVHLCSWKFTLNDLLNLEMHFQKSITLDFCWSKRKFKYTFRWSFLTIFPSKKDVTTYNLLQIYFNSLFSLKMTYLVTFNPNSHEKLHKNPFSLNFFLLRE